MRDAFMDGLSNAVRVAAAVALLFAVITFVRAPEMREEPMSEEAQAC